MNNISHDKKKSEVTIIIPTFNRSDYVQKAIDSSLAQTYPCHIIVCDHGSTDDTPQMIQKYKNKIQYIRKEEDFGPHFCWLDAVLHTNTEYVKILFDDDWIEPTFVEKTLALMQPDISCVLTNASISYEETGKRQLKKTALFNKTGVFRNTLLKNQILLMGGVISPTSCLFRKDELVDGIYQGKLPKKGGNYYHGVGPDMFVLLLGFLRYKKIGFVNEELATYRAHAKSITIKAGKNADKTIKIQKAYEDLFEFYSFLRYFELFKFFYHIDPFRIIRKFIVRNKPRIIKTIKNFIKKFKH